MYYNEKTDEEFTGYMIDESSLISEDIVDPNKVYRSEAFRECMTYFNIEDDLTRKVLLSVNEADQSVIMQSLANKLYKHIIDKVDHIDFGTIPNSKGDIEKIDHYERLKDCLNILAQVLENYNQPVDQVNTVTIAMENIVDNKEYFIRAYKLNAEMPIVLYNTIALSITSAVSLLISSHIEFIKIADNKGYNIAFDRTSKLKGKDSILYKNLEKFNNMCSSGELSKIMEYSLKSNMTMKARREAGEIVPTDEAAISMGAIFGMLGKAPMAAAKGLGAAAGAVTSIATAHPVLATIAAIIVGLLLLIKLIRDLIFYYYYTRTRVSEYLDIQSGLLYMNAMNIQNNLTEDDKKKKEIADKQLKIAKFFSKAADKIKVQDKTAEVKAGNDIKKLDDTKFEINDVISDVPDTAKTSLF